MGKTAGIIIIGNEVLSGKIQDANSPYLCRELRALGVEVKRVSVIPDDLDVISAEVSIFSRTYDLVFTTGGVGPTHDDLTIPGIARAFGVGIVRQGVLEKVLRDYYGPNITADALRMAEVPEGSELLGGDRLLFPAVRMRNVYIFPGIPSICCEKFEAVKELFREAPFVLKTVYVRAGEGTIAGDLHRLLAEYPQLLLGSYPEMDNKQYLVKVTLESKDPPYVEKACARLVELLPPGSIFRIA